MNAPVAERLVAPSAWQTIDFISDLHLTADAPRTFDAFADYIGSTPADALFVLGDLFELWIGDDARDDPFNRRCIALLAAFGRSRPLYFICGNRDFLVGPALLAESSLRALAEPSRLVALGHTILMSHGDPLVLDDKPYQVYRREVRSAPWQAAFLARPIEERLAIARKIRADSHERKQAEPDLSKWADVDEDECRRWLRANHADVLVHGHTHRPGDTPLGDGLVRRTLSDWDLDTPRDRAEVLRLDASGWHRLPVRPAG